MSFSNVTVSGFTFGNATGSNTGKALAMSDRFQTLAAEEQAKSGNALTLDQVTQKIANRLDAVIAARQESRMQLDAAEANPDTRVTSLGIAKAGETGATHSR